MDWLETKPSNIPANVVRKYEDNGWKGFKDFLHSDKHRKHIKSFMKYREAKALVVGLGIKSEAEYLDYVQGKLVDKYGKAPKNLPPTISQIDNGLVNSNSIVPCLFSSEKLRMVTAGIKKIKIQGANLKNGLKSANPEFKILKSPSKTHKNKPFSNKNTAMTK